MPKLEQPVKQANASADGAKSESSAPSYLRICSHYQEHIPQISDDLPEKKSGKSSSGRVSELAQFGVVWHQFGAI
jgi:hypothetical protein